MTNTSETRIIRYDDLPLGGFAGIVEKQMVLNPQVWPEDEGRKDISFGLDDFIYLSMGYFKPNDGAPLHPHKDVDIVSYVLEGHVGHKGTLGDGTSLHGPEIQVQRAGSGMEHSEFNLKDTKAEIVQIWFRPPQKDLEPQYKNFKVSGEKLTTVLGGNDGETLENNMKCQVGALLKGETLTINHPFIALITEGRARVNEIDVSKGDLIEGSKQNIFVESKIGIVLIQANQN